MKNRSLIVLILLLVYTLSVYGQNSLTITESGYQPTLAKSPDGTIGVVYGAGKDIYFSFSKDDGKTFSQPEKVSNHPGLVLGMSSGPQIAMSNRFYTIMAPDSDGNLSAWRKSVGGKVWDGPFRVNELNGSAGESLGDIASDKEGRLYATWIDTRREGMDHEGGGHEMAPGGKEIRQQEAGESHDKVEKKRESAGGHDMTPQRLTKEEIMKQVGEMPEGAEGIRTYPGEDGKLYWVVVDKEGNALKAQDIEGYKKFKAQNGNRPKPQGKIFVSKSEDGGKTWTKSQMVYASPEGSVCECCKPSLITDEGDVYLMFRNNLEGNRDLYLSKSSDGGVSFSTPEKLGMGNWQISGCPMDGGFLDAIEGNVQTVWQREGKVYSSAPGLPEQLIGNGRSPATAITKKGSYFLWNQGAAIMAKTPNSPMTQNLGKGSGAQLIGLEDGVVLGVWMADDKVVARKIGQ